MRDDDLPAVAAAAAAGIHDDSLRPFTRAWAGKDPLAMGQALASRYWKYRALSPTEEWALPLIARHHGDIVGVQGFEAVKYCVLRTPDPFSWLTSSVQGQGIGTLMRQALCAFLFDELDAVAITSGAYLDNPASAAVSRKVGFASNGAKRELRDDGAADHLKFILDRERFNRLEESIHVQGGAAMREFVGVRRQHEP